MIVIRYNVYARGWEWIQDKYYSKKVYASSHEALRLAWTAWGKDVPALIFPKRTE